MKKYLALAVLAMAAVTASAQHNMWMGGSMSVNTDSNDQAEKNSKEFTIAPEMGFNFSDHWAMGIALAYSHQNQDIITNSFAINPFVRYTCSTVGNFCFFLDTGVGYGIHHINGVDDNINHLKIGMNPGMKYCINDRMGLVAHMGEISFTHAWQDDEKTDNFHASIIDDISFGFYINL